MAEKTYRLKITREGNEFEAEGDKKFVMEMLALFSPQTSIEQLPPAKGGEDSKHGGKKPSGVLTTNATKALSIREFIQKFRFTKHTDITLAFGYYLEKYSGVSEFSRADINNCYYEAKLERSNTSQMITQNIKRGYMMSSKKQGTKSLYTLTSTGEEFIKSRVSGSPS